MKRAPYLATVRREQPRLSLDWIRTYVLQTPELMERISRRHAQGGTGVKVCSLSTSYAATCNVRTEVKIGNTWPEHMCHYILREPARRECRD